MTSEEIDRWFQASSASFEDIDKAAERFVAVVCFDDRTAIASGAIELLAILIRGQELPPVPDPDAQRHFSAGLASYRDAVETLARTDDEAEMSRAIRAINSSNGEFARMYESLCRAPGWGPRDLSVRC